MPPSTPETIYAGVQPDLARKVQQVLRAMAAFGYPMHPITGLRTVAQQQALYAQGRSAPGPIVTKCDGVVHRSAHQASEDGLGRAIDCVFDGETPFDPHAPWNAFGALGKAVGLVWGGDFTTLRDLDHLELPHHITG